MKDKTIKIKFDRIIPTTSIEAYKAWLNPKVKGTPWNIGEKIIFTPKIDGFFYWLVNGTPHYGRFTKLKRGQTIQHTWMSPYTEGLESVVTVTFKKKGTNTLMTLVHSGLPNSSKGRAHEGGWNEFMNEFPESFK